MSGLSGIAPNMTGDEGSDLAAELADSRRRLQAILELASSEVIPVSSTEEKLEDAEVRLNRIYDLARGEEVDPDR